MRIDLPESRTLVHECTLPIRWGDMDAFGHVNNTVYFRYMEIARIDWLVTQGLMEPNAATGPVVVNAFCNFLRQVTFPGDLLLRQYISKPGRSSFDAFVTMARTDEPGTTVAEGGATVVWVEYAAQKSVPLPRALADRLNAVPTAD